jgi:hypothetical protein
MIIMFQVEKSQLKRSDLDAEQGGQASAVAFLRQAQANAALR